jgi:hypothetical protein
MEEIMANAEDHAEDLSSLSELRGRDEEPTRETKDSARPLRLASEFAKNSFPHIVFRLMSEKK